MACPPLFIFSVFLRRRRKLLLVVTCLITILTVLVLWGALEQNGSENINTQNLIERQKLTVNLAPRRKTAEVKNHAHYITKEMVEIPETADPLLHEGHEKIASSSTTSSSSRYNASSACYWANTTHKPPYFLSAVLLVRIYATDKAKLTSKELKMWLQYLRYAGIEHVYVYDAWVEKSESQQSILKAFESDGYITYVDWHTHNPYTISGTQVAAYQHCIDHYKHESQWQAAIDIDEYPFSPKDTNPGFLYRYLEDFSTYHREVSEISMQNFLFLGKPLEKELMIERLFRRTPKPSNHLVKPIYKPDNVHASVHHNSLRRGTNLKAPEGELRMNHYWGARLQDWGEDTEEILKKTTPDYSMRPIIQAFKNCESQVRPYLE